MSGTLASLIRQLQEKGRKIYAAPATDRVSAPGRYDQTGSQRSPAFDRRIEKQATKDLGKDLATKYGLTLGQIGVLEDMEDLNDLINGDTNPPDPDYPDSRTPPTPLDPPLPPETPLPPIEPPPATAVNVYVLHDGFISHSKDGGASFARFDCPSHPVGFAVTGHGVYVATQRYVSFSKNLSDWIDLDVPVSTPKITIGSFANGSFESGLAGWSLVNGDMPFAGTPHSHIVPRDGLSYLGPGSGWFGGGAYTIEQRVRLTSEEVNTFNNGAKLRLSADVICWDGGTGEVVLVATGGIYTILGDEIAAPVETSDAINGLSLSGKDGAPAGNGVLRFVYSYEFDKVESLVSHVSIQAHLTVEGVEYSHPAIEQENIEADDCYLRNGSFNRSLTVTLNGGPGFYELTFPAGWTHPISSNVETDAVAQSSADNFATIEITMEEVVLDSASSSSGSWDTLVLDFSPAALPGDDYSFAVRLDASGGNPDVYFDNVRLELSYDDHEEANITAISSDGGQVLISSNGILYSVGRTDMDMLRMLAINPNVIADDGSCAADGSQIWTGSDIVTAPGTVNKIFGSIVLAGDGPFNFSTGVSFDMSATGRTSALDIHAFGGSYFVLLAGIDDSPPLLCSTQDFVNYNSGGNLPTAPILADKLANIGKMIIAYSSNGKGFYYRTSTGWKYSGELRGEIVDIW